MTAPQNPLLNDRDVEFLLYEVLDAPRLCELPYFADHTRETFDLYLQSCRRFAREVLFPTYRPVDASPPRFDGGAVAVHPALKQVFRPMIELGVLTAARPADVGGQQLPLVVAMLAGAYLMAANLSACGYLGLTTAAAHLIQTFGDETLKSTFMTRLYAGEWTGTMALTEPQAGSSLADVQARAERTQAGHYLVRGSKIFISGGDHDLAENIVHLVLARIDGAPPGIKGVSLFAVPKRRPEGGRLVPNDVEVAGVIHKIGWRGLPSLAMSFGERGDCHGYLVGNPHQGISYMFQMMNEARIMVGVNAAATASAAYHEALGYALARPQGRPLGSKDPRTPQVPIVEHADVRRMLLRQKAIVEGSLALVSTTARYADLAAHAEDPAERERAQRLLDLLTPITKTFPAEKGFESNALALQVHGGYGYSSEYLPEAWLRDQKLNSIHEGTTGIQGLDLLGRKVVAGGGAALMALGGEVEQAIGRARRAGVEPAWCERLGASMALLGELTMHLAESGLRGDAERMLRHSADYLELASILVVAWQWLAMAAAAREGLARGASPAGFYEGKLCAAQYWFSTELPRAPALAALCRSGEDSYARMRPEWF
ncbi:MULTISPECIES: acyl-CoA dehydrogenase [Sorangium]|uniref:Acyl-CoA dehydrogenase n=1 Tax=Sorangium cellulosum TaxID=56 RepID=A0A4P2QWE3_SORCE|nr:MULTISPECIES: acyl-CoA dehydrogenase [Sorangium]AUX34725.1 acyl-CoA dehydrogenase [Sorangium cellulosum]WCQ94037.1 Butyryl-CoA dehydrogenase [Sorangium sp. Soce836]